MSHPGTRASADPRTADLCTRRNRFVLNNMADRATSGPLVALCRVAPWGNALSPGAERKRAVANSDRRSRIADRPKRI